MIYPTDPNGDTLRHMAAQGDDLTKPRNIISPSFFQMGAQLNSLQNTFMIWVMRSQ